MSQLTRRFMLKLAAASSSITATIQRSSASLISKESLQRVEHWDQTFDRVWLGESVWANPMEDWHVVQGGAECKAKAGDRNIHLLTHQLHDTNQPFRMVVSAQRVEHGLVDSGVGFRIGVKSDLNEFRSNVFAKNGVKAGIVGTSLVLGPNQMTLRKYNPDESVLLELSGYPVENQANSYSLTLKTIQSGEVLGEISARVPSQSVLGNLSLVNGFENTNRGRGSRYRFTGWSVGGQALKHDPQQAFGPILWTMYTLSDSRSQDGFVLKLSALTGPLGVNDNITVVLEIEKSAGVWEKIASADLDTEAWVATFRLTLWDATKAHTYRVVYQQKQNNGKTLTSFWSGNIKANPVGRPLRLGALTCQNDYAFPYEPVANNVAKLDPDMLYFSGDQIYENHGGYGIIREPAEPAILNYLRKFYQFGWSFREVLKDRPTVCIPDDHDVFQGNIWGEAGKKMDLSNPQAVSLGGYREPARMVNVVHKTCVSHHPDFFDPTPVEQHISVYFGDMVYGNVSFAILGDRQWKSGPERVATWKGRADHVTDPDFDMQKLDQPGLVLLGDRQERFLKQWGQDWRGHAMKVVLSQTVFAAVATHHGAYDGYLRGDLDSGAWPQTPRNNAIRIMRESQALHINGDQHLSSLCQYGVDQQRDCNWSFCTPAIAAGYPRWWRPGEVGIKHENRPRHGLDNTGEFIDSFGNKVYVYAVGNPEVGTAPNRYQKAHQKGSGFGLVSIDTESRTYKIECFRFLIDPTDGKPENQFPGWPVTIHQAENQGNNRLE